MECKYLSNFRKKACIKVLKLSLKIRLGIVFTVLMGFAAFFAIILMFRQHQISVNGATIAIRAHENMTIAIEMRKFLKIGDRKVRSGEFPEFEIRQFRQRLKTIESESFLP